MLSFYWVVYQHQKLKVSSVDVLHQLVQLQLNSNYSQYSLCDCAKSLEASYRKGGWEISILVAVITTYCWHWSICEEISLWYSRNTFIHGSRGIWCHLFALFLPKFLLDLNIEWNEWIPRFLTRVYVLYSGTSLHHYSISAAFMLAI